MSIPDKKEPICGLYALLRALMKKYITEPTTTTPAVSPITNCQLMARLVSGVESDIVAGSTLSRKATM
jgi:hypothetical protein